MKVPQKVKKLKPKTLSAGISKKKSAVTKKSVIDQKPAAKKLNERPAKAPAAEPKKGQKSKKGEPAKKSTVADTEKLKKSHKEQLEGLKDIDPEFYDFLQANDKKLLDFNLWDSDDDDADDLDEKSDTKRKAKQPDKKSKNKKSQGKSDSDSSAGEEDLDDDDDDNDDAQEDDDDSGEDEESMDQDEPVSDDESVFHKPTDDLEVASDESDYEDGNDDDEDATTGTQKVTLNLLRQWQQQLEQANPSIDVIRKVIQAFSSALASITSDLDGGNEGQNGASATTNTYKVVGGATFNGVVQLCVLHLQPAIMRYLGVPARSNMPLHKTKKWVKVRGCLRYYLTDLIRLVEQVSGANILAVLLKHLHQVAGMVSSYSALGKTILKRLIVIWSSGEETVRVLAFLCILKITRNQQVSMLHHVLKAMYLSYVRNSKFVSPNTLPGINFMRRSLIEIFALDLAVSYQHAFLYIRQLAIHLRNAVILKKKDSFQAVYNWQFVNSLRLWCDLLGSTADKPQLQPLIYPLVTIATGVVRLIPTAQYFPLRFHCLQAIVSLCKETRTYVPVLPLILEVLRSNTFNSKHTQVSMRPLQFTCILRLNKAQLSENGFRDEVVEQVCSLTLEYLAHESASLAFSDLIVPAVIALKAYLKDCRNANYSRKLKQLLDKMQENGRFIEQERRRINFGLKDLPQIQAWEQQVRNKGTPLDIYYTSWVKTHEMKKRRQAAQADTVNSDYDLPKIKRSNKPSTGVTVRNERGEIELFPSDDDDDDYDGLPELPVGQEEEDSPPAATQSNKGKKAAKKEKKKLAAAEVDIPIEDPDVDGGVDIVKDLDLDDW